MSIPRLKSYLMMFAAVLMLGQVLTAQAEEALPDFTTLVQQLRMSIAEARSPGSSQTPAASRPLEEVSV